MIAWLYREGSSGKRYSQKRKIKKRQVVRKMGNRKAHHLFRLSTLGRLEEEHLLLHHGVVLEHGERAMRTGPDHGAVETCHRHGDQADGDGA